MIALLQPLRQSFVYSRFGDPKVLCAGTDGGIFFDHIHSQLTGPLLKVIFHRLPSDAVCWKIL